METTLQLRPTPLVPPVAASNSALETLTEGNAQSLFFSKLPVEIRNQIYALALPTASTIRSGNLDSLATFRSDPPITRVCKQARSETLPLYYGSNEFQLDTYGHGRGSTSTVREWFRILGEERAGLVKHIHLGLTANWGSNPPKRFQGLQTLTVDGKELFVEYSFTENV